MDALASLGTVFFVIMGLIGVFMIITFWILFEKANQPGWAILIPIYNVLVLLKVAGKEWWWVFGVLLIIIPVVGQILYIIWMIIIFHGVSVNFGKGAGFTVGLVLLSFVFFPILAFGSATFQPVEKKTVAPEAEAKEQKSEE